MSQWLKFTPHWGNTHLHPSHVNFGERCVAPLDPPAMLNDCEMPPRVFMLYPSAKFRHPISPQLPYHCGGFLRPTIDIFTAGPASARLRPVLVEMNRLDSVSSKDTAPPYLSTVKFR